MLERAFVFEITAEASRERAGVGAVCLARREVALWTAGEGARLVGSLPARQWIRLERELVSDLPTLVLADTSAVAKTLSALFRGEAVRVHYLGVFPVEAADWLPASHPAAAVLNGLRTPAAIATA